MGTVGRSLSSPRHLLPTSILAALVAGCGAERVVSVDELCAGQGALPGEVVNVDLSLPGNSIYLHSFTTELCAPDETCCNEASYVYGIACPEGPTIGFVPPRNGTVDSAWLCQGQEPPCLPDCPALTLTARGELSSEVRRTAMGEFRDFVLSPQ